MRGLAACIVTPSSIARSFWTLNCACAPICACVLPGRLPGVEGYVESAAIGLLAGRFAAAECLGTAISPPPPTTALGALLSHITGGHVISGENAQEPRSFQPMNVNFGLFPPMEPEANGAGKKLKGAERGAARKKALSARALRDLSAWLDPQSVETCRLGDCVRQNAWSLRTAAIAIQES